MTTTASSFSTLTLELSEPFKIVVENRLITISPYIFLEQETWFEPEASFFNEFLKPAMRFVDIGANCGFYTLLAAHKVGPEGHVWSFEPGLKPKRLLKESLRINNYQNVTLFETAIGNEPGTIWFQDMIQSELSAVVDGPMDGAREVTMESLDHLYRAGTITNVDVVKIDAEGFEDRVILGARDFFTRESPLVMMEIISDAQTTANMAPTEQLYDLGYEPYRYCPGLNCLVPLVMNKFGDYVLNIFLCKPDRAAAMKARGLLVTKDDIAQDYDPANPAVFLDYFVSLPAVQSSTELQALSEASYADAAGFITMAAEFVLSKDKARSIAERYIRLLRAEQWIDANFSMTMPFTQIISFLRVLLACGRITLVAGILKSIAAGEIKVVLPLSYPFFPLSQKWEATPVIAGALSPWLASMLSEGLELSRSFSSIYQSEGTQDTYDLARKCGYLTPALERRAALVTITSGHHRFSDFIYIAGENLRNQKIWNEIAQRLKQGETRFSELNAGVMLDLAD